MRGSDKIGLPDELPDEDDRRSGIGRRRQEVGEAGDQHHGGLGLNGTEGLGEESDLTTGQDLARRHHGTIATVHGVHVTLHIRVAEYGEHVAGHLRFRLSID